MENKRWRTQIEGLSGLDTNNIIMFFFLCLITGFEIGKTEIILQN